MSFFLCAAYEETSDAPRQFKAPNPSEVTSFPNAAAPKHRRSVRQTDSSLCTASLQDFSSVRRFHSLAEAVDLASVELFRLVSSQHRVTLPYFL
jgi:hypothetical protein